MPTALPPWGLIMDVHLPPNRSVRFTDDTAERGTVGGDFTRREVIT